MVGMLGEEANYLRNVANVAKATTTHVVFSILGIVAAASLFFKTGLDPYRGTHRVKNNLYSICCDQVSRRFRDFYRSVATVMGAQITISLINTALTAIFLMAVHVPHAPLLIAVTFLCGLVPIVGNLVSNIVIVFVGLTVSLKLAISALLSKRVNRIILARPAVEAGERLGFLPGTLQDKIDPYLRPLYDALYDMLPTEQVERRIASGEIEIAPIAFMRGRTLNDAFIILDEAQNTSPEQMKMFLTRLGFGSKIVVTGDVTQVDLPNGTKSGLRIIEGILDGVEDIVFNRLTSHDVVRHRLVGKIVAAYDEADARGETATTANPRGGPR